jgi:hypothetical protein
MRKTTSTMSFSAFLSAFVHLLCLQFLCLAEGVVAVSGWHHSRFIQSQAASMERRERDSFIEGREK